MMQCPGCGATHVHTHADAGIEQLFDATSAGWLEQAGIPTLAHLSAIGAIDTYLRVEALGVKPGLNLLYALDGAIRGEHWLEAKRLRKTELLLALSAARELVST
jgi:DNA transformation protein